MRLARPLVRTLILTLLLIPLTLPGGTVHATPVAEEPHPGPCNALHRNITGMASVFATPVARIAPPATPAGTPPAPRGTPRESGPAPEPIGTPRLLRPELPAGEPAPAEVVAGITRTMQRYLACANAGDVIGLISLVSDAFLRQSFGNVPMSEADLRAYADSTTPLPLAQRRRLLAIREAREVTPRVYVALVDTAPITSDNPNAVTTDLVTFVPDDHGNYLIDQYVAGVTVWFGPNATPAP